MNTKIFKKLNNFPTQISQRMKWRQYTKTSILKALQNVMCEAK